MSHPSGKYLGGIRSVEDMRQRCRIDETSGCWRWGLAIVSGSPKVHFVDCLGRRRTTRGRRAALILKRGRDIPAGHQVFPVLACEHDDCVNPDHARAGTRHELGKYLRAAGKDVSPARLEHLRKLAARRRKLTPEQVIEIRTSAESTYAVAKRLGISQFAAWSARVGHSHKHVGIARSAFEWATHAAGAARNSETP